MTNIYFEKCFSIIKNIYAASYPDMGLSAAPFAWPPCPSALIPFQNINLLQTFSLFSAIFAMRPEACFLAYKKPRKPLLPRQSRLSSYFAFCFFFWIKFFMRAAARIPPSRMRNPPNSFRSRSFSMLPTTQAPSRAPARPEMQRNMASLKSTRFFCVCRQGKPGHGQKCQKVQSLCRMLVHAQKQCQNGN